MAPSPDGNGVILIGGYSSGNILDTIFELKADGQGWVGSWATLSTKLQYANTKGTTVNDTFLRVARL